MAAKDDKALEYIAQAEKKLKSFSLFSGGSKFEDAAELYTKAANVYKMSKQWDDAGMAFKKSSEFYLKSQSKHEAATAYCNAANCYKKSNITEAINCMHKAVEFYTDDGRFSIAAKYQKEIAELWESESNLERAIEAYQTAADYYEGESSSSSANQCLLRVAEFSAQLENYDKAIEIYEQVASNSLGNNLLKWSVKEYLLRAAICHLCSEDVVAAKRSLQRYQDMDVTFATQRECKFLQQIMDAYEAGEVEDFTNAVVDFDSISKLDPWKTTMLLRIKNHINKEEESII